MKKTLANAKLDPRVSTIEKLSPNEFIDARYCVNLKNGYILDDGSATAYVSTVEEVWWVLDHEVKVDNDDR